MKKVTIGCLALTTLMLLQPTHARSAEKQETNRTEVKQDTIPATTPKKAEEGERNVLLNASDANKPREIQIGLPSEDVNVYENGLPAVYSSTIHQVSAHWRADSSLGSVGLLTPSESAITTGNIAYAVNSFTQLGSDDFRGILNYKANHFGMQQFDMNLSGGIGKSKNWLYSAGVYQNFDPGTFKIKFTDFNDRTQIYKAALTRKLGGDRGKISLLYKYSYDRRMASVTTAAPFIYVGDGSVKEVPGFNLGTSSYAPESGRITFMNVMTGAVQEASINDFTLNKANEVSLLSDYRFDNDAVFTFNAKYMDATANYTDFGGSTIAHIENGVNLDDASDERTYYNGDNLYNGLKEGRRTWLHAGKVSNFLLTSELKKQSGNHNWRIGLNEWYYHIDYHSSSTQWNGTVREYPEILSFSEKGSTDRQQFYGFNELSPEYTKGYENKLAVYFTDNWDITRKLNLYFGGRLEYYRMDAEQLPYDRFTNFHIGAVIPAQGGAASNGTTVTPQTTTKNKLNYAATAQLTYNMTKNFGLTADGSVTTRYPRINEYAGKGPTEEEYKQVLIPLVRGGVYYKNDWLHATSMVSYISKSNNIDQQNVTKPGTAESQTKLLIYSIQTIGWTTSAEITPFKGFHLHALFTYQKPTYKNYKVDVTFRDGQQFTLDATGNIVKEIPQILVELDPSYNITKYLRVWLSFRYFGKTYANLTDALYFNGRWETFGGVNWTVNKHLSLGATVVNFLNQTGASGTIQGSELTSKEEAAKFNNHYMSGNYLRPLTFELSASIKF